MEVVTIRLKIFLRAPKEKNIFLGGNFFLPKEISGNKELQEKVPRQPVGAFVQAVALREQQLRCRWAL